MAYSCSFAFFVVIASALPLLQASSVWRVDRLCLVSVACGELLVAEQQVS